jgi:hypothetical protein
MKVGYKFTPEQRRRLSLSHMGQVAWNKGTGGCKKGHAPEIYRAMPSGVKVCLGCKKVNGAAWRQKNQEANRDKNRGARYGLSADDIKAIWQRQGGKCAICESLLPGRKFHIDHNHSTGAVRGLLCVACNTALGLMGESLGRMARAIDYLGHAD